MGRRKELERRIEEVAAILGAGIVDCRGSRGIKLRVSNAHEDLYLRRMHRIVLDVPDERLDQVLTILNSSLGLDTDG